MDSGRLLSQYHSGPQLIAMNPLSNTVFHDVAKAREWLEAQLWPDGPICPECGTIDNATSIKTRKGWYQCNTKD